MSFQVPGEGLSVFDVIGPAMIGPSSSHTAGVVRLGLAGRALLGGQPSRAFIGLHGSLAATGLGHATDRAIVAGLLGMKPDDSRLPCSHERAAAVAFEYTLAAEELGETAHPNTVHLELERHGGRLSMYGASLGGGVVEVNSIDGHPVAWRGSLPALACWHEDSPGFLAVLTALIAAHGANIATLRTHRRSRGADALTVVELDAEIPAGVALTMAEIAAVRAVRSLPVLA